VVAGWAVKRQNADYTSINRDMKILVTGGAGYVGNSLVTALNSHPAVVSVVVYDNLSRGTIPFFFGTDKLKKVRFIHADILNSYALEQALKGMDTVIHLAGHVVAPFNHLQNLQYEQINRWGSLALVRAIEQGVGVERLLYLSTTAVYGFGSDVDPHQEPMPENAYGSSKYEAEKYIRLLSGRLRTGIIRAANVYGFNPCLRTDGVINAFLYDALTIGQIRIYGNGQQERPFIQLKQLTDQLLHWLEDEEAPGLQTAATCNASLNEIKDWLLTQLPELEYTYLNQNQSFNSQRLAGLGGLDSQQVILEATLDDFRSQIRLA
jgi:UDP-glucose 4-epimerase